MTNRHSVPIVQSMDAPHPPRLGNQGLEIEMARKPLTTDDTYTVAMYAELDIRRPNGTVDTIKAAYNGRTIKTLTDHEFKKYAAAIKVLGKGEAIAYRNVTEERNFSAAEVAEYNARSAAEVEYISHHNAVLRMASGGEECDQIGGVNDIDRTPATKADY